MTIEQRGFDVTGVYHYGNTEGRITGTLGTVGGDTLRFRYEEPNERGEGVFRLLRAGKFTGSYTVAGEQHTRRWKGERGWDGLWVSDFGRMRLLHEVFARSPQVRVRQRFFMARRVSITGAAS